MTVLSTSKKAAAVGSGGVARACSTSVAEADASPAITDRERRFGGFAGAGGTRISLAWPCARLGVMTSGQGTAAAGMTGGAR